jgi:nucleoside-diphosphate-sugar epimerase
MSSLIIGCGYLGERVAKRLLAAGETVTGTARSTMRLNHLKSLGIEPFAFDSTQEPGVLRLPVCERAVHCVGYDRRSGISRSDVVVDGLRRTLDRLETRSLHRFVLISTTSVYAQQDGSWVDENSPTEPRTEAGRLALAAEEIVQNWAQRHQVSAVILRLAGIYGPHRILGRDILRAGGSFGGDPDRWLNLIHVEDAASAAVRALDTTCEGIILIADGHPVSRRVFYAEVAQCLGLNQPVFDPNLPAEREANRRIGNRRMRGLLLPRLLYPDIQAGIPAALASE